MSDTNKTFDDVKEYVTRVAKTRGWKLHPNHDNTLDMLIEGLRDYFNAVGYYNCPCRDSNRDRKKDRDIMCPCDYAEPDIEEYGRCYCALFFDPDFDFDEKTIGMIPERRPIEKEAGFE